MADFTLKYQELNLDRGTLRGFLTEPKEPKKDLVVMFHGFTGHKNENGFFIESEIPGSSFFCRVFLGNCGEEKAKKTAAFLAEKAVHPVHTEDIICDMIF